ncbi:hypothetical protein LIER_22291 [Lithospermum erythrorhizon]|uniref:Uncharacterized protein n=1 Tax=Lithospermum erythrorhizon TaxID=34254 RepID=A0AAV3QTH8_LITER
MITTKANGTRDGVIDHNHNNNGVRNLVQQVGRENLQPANDITEEHSTIARGLEGMVTGAYTRGMGNSELIDLGFMGHPFTWWNRRDGEHVDLDEAWGEDEKYWCARAKEKYLKEGDKNTIFSHASAMMRRRRNLLLGLDDDRGVWQDGSAKVEEIVLRHFDSIFCANDDSNPEVTTYTLNRQVSEEMNQQLTRVVTSEEVKRVVFEMPADKSPSPDGMTEAEERKAITESTKVRRILNDYERASGQKVNVGKCVVSFSSKTGREARQHILVALNMNKVRDQGKYLGRPAQIGRTKKDVFRYIQTRVEGRVLGWKGKLLSQAGKEVIISRLG